MSTFTENVFPEDRLHTQVSYSSSMSKAQRELNQYQNAKNEMLIKKIQGELQNKNFINFAF